MMDIPQALQEMQRLRSLLESGQIRPDVYAQAINQLQIQDSGGFFWHVDGTSLRWFRYDGQSWVEQSPPYIPPPPPPGAGRAVAGSTGASLLPLWIGLGILALVAIGVIGVFLSGVVPLPWAATPTPTPSSTPRPSATQFPTVTTARLTSTPMSTRQTTPTTTRAAATLTLSPTPRTTSPTVRPASPTPTSPSASDFLQQQGPWLISRDENNLYRVQPQKTDRINTEKVVAPYDLADMIAPSGGRIAFITSPNPDQMSGLKLVIYNVAGLKVETTIALTSAKTEPAANALPGDPKLEAIRSITVAPGLAWSPDGRKLAFIGVIDGPSSDLYLYSLDTQKVTRLTDGPSQGFAPSWSPDGKYIAQFGATSFGTGAGFSMAGAWATRADNTGSIELYQPKSSGEVGLGWVNANTYVVYSFNAVCGHYNLRTVAIQPLKVTTLFAGCFNAAALDPASGSVILGIVQGQADLCNCAPTKTNAGLYLVSPTGGLKSLASGDLSNVVWLKNASTAWGLIDNKGAVAFTLDGKAVPLPAGLPALQPVVATGGKLWAWTGGASAKQPGVWVGSPAGGAPQVSSLPVSSAVWDKFNTSLVFLSGSDLYAAPPPGYKPVLLVKTNAASQIAWVTP